MHAEDGVHVGPTADCRVPRDQRLRRAAAGAAPALCARCSAAMDGPSGPCASSAHSLARILPHSGRQRGVAPRHAVAAASVPDRSSRGAERDSARQVVVAAGVPACRSRGGATATTCHGAASAAPSRRRPRPGPARTARRCPRSGRSPCTPPEAADVRLDAAQVDGHDLAVVGELARAERAVLPKRAHLRRDALGRASPAGASGVGAARPRAASPQHFHDPGRHCEPPPRTPTSRAPPRYVGCADQVFDWYTRPSSLRPPADGVLHV